MGTQFESLGDLRLYIAPALGLKDQGHEPILATNEGSLIDRFDRRPGIALNSGAVDGTAHPTGQEHDNDHYRANAEAKSMPPRFPSRQAEQLTSSGGQTAFLSCASIQFPIRCRCPLYLTGGPPRSWRRRRRSHRAS
jgi:hypothetical protein